MKLRCNDKGVRSVSNTGKCLTEANEKCVCEYKNAAECGMGSQRDGRRRKGNHMEMILEVQGLKKTFQLSAKQQKIEKTKEKV